MTSSARVPHALDPATQQRLTDSISRQTLLATWADDGDGSPETSLVSVALMQATMMAVTPPASPAVTALG